MMLMAMAADLLVVFLALEVLSLAVYALTGIRRESPAATEAAFKYYLLGAFSSAFFLYGIAFTYGVAGSLRLERIGQVIAAQAMSPSPLHLLAAGLLLVGFAFKVSAVPFHMWTPDAYEGAPPAVAGFMSTGVKAAAFAAFVRVFLAAYEPMRLDWGPIVWVIAAATMIVGSVVGVAQTNVKRMLAYSSIAHAGFILTGLTAANSVGISSALFYLAAYAVMIAGGFGVLMLISARGEEHTDLDSYKGLAHRRPFLAALMTLFLLSMAGVPPTVGFIAKASVFGSAVSAGNWPLAIIAVLCSVVAAFFYLRVIAVMYMQDAKSTEDVADPDVPALPATVVSIAAAAVLVLGVFPGLIWNILQSVSVLRW